MVPKHCSFCNVRSTALHSRPLAASPLNADFHGAVSTPIPGFRPRLLRPHRQQMLWHCIWSVLCLDLNASPFTPQTNTQKTLTRSVAALDVMYCMQMPSEYAACAFLVLQASCNSTFGDDEDQKRLCWVSCSNPAVFILALHALFSHNPTG